MSDYDPKDIQTAIKTLWALVIFTGISFIALVAKSSQASPFLDVSLGSMVGAIEQPESGQVPFWGEVGYSVGGYYAGLGHRSNVEKNGNETDYEYLMVGRSASCVFYNMNFYGQVEGHHIIRGNLNRENVLSVEGGVKQGQFRFGAFYETATGLNIQGLKAGYTF